MPVVVPVKLAEQVLAAPLPPSVQLTLAGDAPAPLAVRLTVPVGPVAPGAVSVTVMVQLLATPNTIAGQLTAVVVECNPTMIDPLPALEPCVESLA